MDSALALHELTAALGGLDGLPSPEDLQLLLARAELGRFMAWGAVSAELESTAWRLHAIAAAGAGRFDVQQRSAAFRVSAQILELRLDESELGEDRLRYGLGAMVGYRLGGLDPNAEAILRRLRRDLQDDTDSLWSPTLAMRAAVRLLGLRTRESFAELKRYRSRLARLEADLGGLEGSTFWPAKAVVEGAIATLRWLVFGDERGLQQAESWFESLTGDSPGASAADRWLGALLRAVCDDFREASIWRSLPADVPVTVRRALTMTNPSVLLLWPPQREILNDSDGPGLLDPDLRRAVLAVPTSAGKTLLASIMVLDHVAREGSSVAFVAPMRSLVREVRGRLRPRLRAVDDTQDVGSTPPDFFAAALRDLFGPATVDVFTPERLLAALRRDPNDVLGRYGMFVFDEAHHIGDAGRGFVLEEALSFLHTLTADRRHRIVLLSAALGNDATVRAWFGKNVDETRGWSSSWRGPRQLYAVYSTKAHWAAMSAPYKPSPKSNARRDVPLTAGLRLSVAGLEGPPVTAELPYSVGHLVQRLNNRGRWVRDTAASTSQFDEIASIAAAVQHGGPVLTVTWQRDDAQKIALALAARRENRSGNQLLIDLVTSRLGANHPLSVTVRRGVAFHHAGLPPEVLNAVVSELEAGALPHVVCTTTLTDGVNLPVHSVVLGELFRGPDRQIRGSKLLNAIGRAGRAGIETTGWIVLYAPRDTFDTAERVLRPDAKELEARSLLARDEALADLRRVFETDSDIGDLIYGDPPPAIRDFISFIWWLAAAREQLILAHDDTVEQVLRSTLGFAQLEEADAALWLRLSESVLETYLREDEGARRRWAAAGLSVASSSRLDELADGLADAARRGAAAATATLDGALQLVRDAGILRELRKLPESPTVRWPPAVPLDDALGEWVRGKPLPELAAEHLALHVDDPQTVMVETASQLFEYFLPWTLASVIDEANRRLAAEEVSIYPALALHVRYGVDTEIGVKVSVDGVRSRGLAQAIGIAAREEEVSVDRVAEWLAEQGPRVWRDRFAATESDVVDLLDLSRGAGTRTLQDLLRGASVVVQLDSAPGRNAAAELWVSPEDGNLTVVAVDDRSAVFRIAAAQHADLQAVRRAGTPLRVRLEPEHAVLEVDREAFA